MIFQNTLVQFIALFIPGRARRHDFRSRYKRKTKYRKLKDDLNAIRAELSAVGNKVDNLNTRRYFRFGPSTVIRYRNFIEYMNTPKEAQRYRRLIDGLDNESLDCVATIIGRISLIARQEPSRGGVGWTYLPMKS